MLSQELPPSMQTGPHRTDGAVHLLRDLFVAPLLDVRQDDGGPVVIRKHAQRGLNLLALRAQYDLLLGTGRLVRHQRSELNIRSIGPISLVQRMSAYQRLPSPPID